MSIESQIPYSWVRNRPHELIKTDQIPLFGALPLFPWENYAKILKEKFHLSHFKLTQKNIEWIVQDEILKGYDSNPLIFPFQISNLEGVGQVIFAKDDFIRLLRNLFKEDEPFLDLNQETFFQEFSYFILLETLESMQDAGYDNSLIPHLIDNESNFQAPALAIEFEIEANQVHLPARILISAQLRESIAKKYHTVSLKYPEPLSELIKVPLEFVAGHTALLPSEWKLIQPGDFLILDSCTLSLEEDKGRITLYANNAPLFRGKIKDGNIKVLEFPVLEEVALPMAKHPEYEDEDFETEEETETESFEDHDYEDDDEIDDEEDDLEEDLEDQSLVETEQEEEEEEAAAKETTPKEKKAAIPAELKQPVSAQKMPKPDEIPMTVSIEVGRVQMSIKQLMELAPGNILELNVHPEEGVDLVVNGVCIGKGELLKIGDALGVRILEKA